MNVQKNLISVFHTPDNNGSAKVFNGPTGPFIEYYDAAGHYFFTEEYPEESISKVEDLAENWAMGYKMLNE